jgi:hypothetical protein
LTSDKLSDTVSGMSTEEVQVGDEPVSVGTISNWYGGLIVRKDSDGRCWWAIVCPVEGNTWEEIPADLFQHLLSFSRSL